MNTVETINPINLEKCPEAQKQAAIHQLEEKKKSKRKGLVDPILIAYLEIYKTVQIDNETANLNAKQLEANAVAQSSLINAEALVNFSTVSQSQIKAIATSQRNYWLQQLNSRNQEVSALRNNFGDQLTVLKQSAQMDETKVNTVMNEDQQAISQGSSLMQMLVSLSNQIARI